MEGLAHEPTGLADVAADDDDDDGFIPGSLVAMPATCAGAGGRSRRRPCKEVGSFLAWLLTDDPPLGPAASAGSGARPEPAAAKLMGIARCEWRFQQPCDEVVHAYEQLQPPRHGRASRARPPWGYVEYRSLEVWSLCGDGRVVPGDVDLEDQVAAPHLLLETLGDARLKSGYRDVRALFADKFRQITTSVVLQLPVALASSPDPRLLRSVPLLLRGGMDALLHGLPPHSVVQRWRRGLDVARVSQMPALEAETDDRWADIACELPRKRARENLTVEEAVEGIVGVGEIDPLLLIKGLNFSHLLRDQDDFTDALNRAHDFDAPSDLEGTRDSSRDPSTSTLRRAAGRLDVVGCLIQRRQFKANRLCDRVLGFNLFSDASPVTGEEFQGMILETISRTHVLERSTLPGSTLDYGHCGAVNKGVSLLFALFLVAGPFFCDLAWLLAKVVCLTTDFGIEIKTVAMPWILQALLSWMGGRGLLSCKPLIDHSRRLFIRALRISGWSHLMGNLMKKVAESSGQWPGIIACLRNCCTVLHNATWRKHMQRCLRGQGLDLTPLNSFTPTLIKWRYECIDSVTEKLAELRPLLQGKVTRAWFQNPQDGELVNHFIDGCGSPFFGVYVTHASREVFHPTELQRHWGMVCGCAEHIQDRAEGKSTKHCWRNSRRLREVAEFADKAMREAQTRATALHIRDVEDHNLAHKAIVDQLRAKASGLRMRCKYLHRVPWLFANADEQEHAVEILRQVRSVDLEHHDPLTQDVMRRLGGDIEQVSMGFDASPALLAEVEIFNLAPLDESCGEGYHRGTTMEMKRAPSSASAHLKQNNRFDQELARVRGFMRQFGPRGKRVVRYEWKHWKRVLQTQWAKRWQPKKMTARNMYRRIYHDDEFSQQDWSAIVEKEVGVPAAETEKTSDRLALENEYLDVALDRNHYYSVPVPREEFREDGKVETVQEMQYFQVLTKFGSHRRPKLMPTFDVQEDIPSTASLAVEVLPLQRLPGPVTMGDGDEVHVFQDADPYWVRATDIAPWAAMGKLLKRWANADLSEDQEDVLVLSGSQVVKAPYHPLDDRCPTLCITAQVKKEGWTDYKRTMVVTAENVGKKECDGREAVKWKPYFQVLLAVDRCLPLTSAIPSQQPQKFYKILLRGGTAEPYRSDKEYTVVLNEILKTKHYNINKNRYCLVYKNIKY